MKFDFETIMDRRGHDAIAIDAIGKGGVLGILLLATLVQPKNIMNRLFAGRKDITASKG